LRVNPRSNDYHPPVPTIAEVDLTILIPEQAGADHKSSPPAAPFHITGAETRASRESFLGKRDTTAVLGGLITRG